jgi:hypothetical protein
MLYFILFVVTITLNVEIQSYTMRQDISDKRDTHTQHIINTDKRMSITKSKENKSS